MRRFRSKSGKYIALLPETSNSGFSVVVTSLGVASFNSSWPCSRLREYPIRFEYAANGDLIDILGNQPDGSELHAISQDAQAFGEKMVSKHPRLEQPK